MRGLVPPAMEQAMLKSLAKLPADRFSSAAAFATALAGAGASMGAAQRLTEPRGRGRLRDPVVAALTLVAVVAAATAVVLARHHPDEAFPVRFAISADAQTRVGDAVLTPDDHAVLYVGQSAAGSALYMQRLDQLEARQVPGLQDVGVWGAPALSPDGKWIALVSGNRRKLMKLSIDGGTPVPLADVADNGGIDWAPDGDT